MNIIFTLLFSFLFIFNELNASFSSSSSRGREDELFRYSTNTVYTVLDRTDFQGIDYNNKHHQQRIKNNQGLPTDKTIRWSDPALKDDRFSHLIETWEGKVITYVFQRALGQLNVRGLNLDVAIRSLIFNMMDIKDKVAVRPEILDEITKKMLPFNYISGSLEASEPLPVSMVHHGFNPDQPYFVNPLSGQLRQLKYHSTLGDSSTRALAQDRPQGVTVSYDGTTWTINTRTTKAFFEHFPYATLNARTPWTQMRPPENLPPYQASLLFQRLFQTVFSVGTKRPMPFDESASDLTPEEKRQRLNGVPHTVDLTEDPLEKNVLEEDNDSDSDSYSDSDSDDERKMLRIIDDPAELAEFYRRMGVNNPSKALPGYDSDSEGESEGDSDSDSDSDDERKQLRIVDGL